MYFKTAIKQTETKNTFENAVTISKKRRVQNGFCYRRANIVN